MTVFFPFVWDASGPT